YIDISIEPAAAAVETLVREHLEERGDIYVCVCWPPRRLIPLQNDQPFAGASVVLIGPDYREHRIENLGDGQHYVVYGRVEGVHGKHYRWLGSELATIKREYLPDTRRGDTEQLLDAAVKLLTEKFGFRLKNPADDKFWAPYTKAVALDIFGPGPGKIPQGIL